MKKIIILVFLLIVSLSACVVVPDGFGHGRGYYGHDGYFRR